MGAVNGLLCMSCEIVIGKWSLLYESVETFQLKRKKCQLSSKVTSIFYAWVPATLLSSRPRQALASFLGMARRCSSSAYLLCFTESWALHLDQFGVFIVDIREEWVNLECPSRSRVNTTSPLRDTLCREDQAFRSCFTSLSFWGAYSYTTYSSMLCGSSPLLAMLVPYPKVALS